MKKTIAIILIVLCLLSINNVFATEVNTLEKQNKEEISGIKNKMEEKKEEYTEKYVQRHIGLQVMYLKKLYNHIVYLYALLVLQ